MSDINGAREWYFYTPAATEESPTPEETLLFTNEYDEYGELVKTTAGEEEETYTYDATGKLTHYTGNGITETYTYNNKGQLSQIVYTGLVNKTETYEYTNDSQSILKKITSGGVSLSRTYDKYGRVCVRNVAAGTGCSNVEDITYKTVNDHETNQVNEFRNSVDCFTYTYDKRGNITEIYNWGNLIKKYTYSIQGRLTTEENLSISQKTEYTYNQQGDITQKTRYIKDFNGNYFKPTTKTYTYSTDGKYLMTAYRGQACEYDSLGNPTTYKGKTLVWGQGKRLMSYDGLNFTYDARGRRIQKGNESYYYDSRDRLVRGGVLDYYYADNEVISCAYNGVRYIYCKDVFGNITAILDENESVVVKYDYDAWGNHRVLNNAGAVITDTQHIGHKNPFRYRGYYYDSETGLYYLKSRYYDPETCRFINMDSVEYADPTYLHGLNLYAYCNNNPLKLAYQSVRNITKNVMGSIEKNNSSLTLTKKLRNIPYCVDNLITVVDIVSSLVSPIRTAIATLKYTDIWDLMRLNGITELPGVLAKSMAGVGWGLSTFSGILTGYEKYINGASISSAVAGGIINAGIGIGAMYASSTIATAIVGIIASSSLVIPGGALVVGGALMAIGISAGINYLLTETQIFANTIEGHLNNFIDWLIFWD